MNDPLLKKWRQRFQVLGKYHPRQQIAMHDTLLDPDDEEALLVRRFLEDLGFVRTLGIVANHSPADDPTFRARATKGILNLIGYGDTPVLVGHPSDRPGLHGYEREIDPSLLASESEVIVGNIPRTIEYWMQETIYPVDFVLCSRMTDAANHLWVFPYNGTKLGNVTMMASVLAATRGTPRIILDSRGYLVTGRRYKDTYFKDHYAANWKYDEEAGDWLLHYVQTHGIASVFLSRYAAYHVLMPAKEYDRLKVINHPIAHRLHSVRPRSLAGLWKAACRGEWRSRSWFVNSFMGGKDPGPDIDEHYSDIYHHPHTRGFAFYDALATIASHPALRNYFFEPIQQVVTASDGMQIGHDIIGIPGKPCVKRPAELQEFVMDAIIYALS